MGMAIPERNKMKQFFVQVTLMLGLAMLLGACHQPATPAAAPLSPIRSVDIRPLSPGQFEVDGFGIYTYLIMTGSDDSRRTSAICGFVASRMSATGDRDKDERRSTAAYYLPQKSNLDVSAAPLATVSRNYDDARAASIASRFSLAPSIYLISYVGVPLPQRPEANDQRLDIVELGGLSPTRVYQYVKSYRDQLAPGGEYWKTRTLRQVGIVVAEQLSLVNRVKTMSSYVFKSAEAAESDKEIKDLPRFDESIPAACRQDLTTRP